MAPPLPGTGAPRPPPPPPGCGPPVPPPPPGMGPPPPPGGLGMPVAPQIPSFLNPKTVYKPEVTLKKLNWKVVAPNSLTEEAFWAKTREDRLGSQEFFNELHTMFSTAVPVKNKDKDCTEGGDGRKKVQKKAKELKVLDGKAAQTLGTVYETDSVSFRFISGKILFTLNL